MNWWRHCLTGADNKTFDIARVLAALSVLVFLGLAIYAVVKLGQAWDPQAFGVGLGAVFAAIGVCLKLKEETEPKP